ncbi:MAG: septation protein SpoVG family protein [Acutalibacteraceae bacterium]
MEITSIRINFTKTVNKRLRAYATIVIDNVFAINDIKIIQAEHRLCVDFPKTEKAKIKNQCTIAPLNTETRAYIENTILKTYFEKLKHKDVNV